MEYVKIIHDEKELKWFFDNVMPPLKETEVYFISLSARNKYLTEEERKHYELGRTEMFEKSIIRRKEWDRFIRLIRKFECDTRGYTTKNHMPIPAKSLVCYLNVNPSDSFKALSNFQGLIHEYYTEMSALLTQPNRNTENFFNRINKIDNNLMTMYQQATGTRHYMDIDFDFEEKQPHIIEPITDYLKDKGIEEHYWIDTKSGYHLLINRNQLKFNPNDIIKFCFKQIGEESKDGVKEITLNKNEMIPLPGTYQGQYPVKVLNKGV